ncbi:MAG: hypothetical protein MJE12_25590 [Alphaproteobacteria bacterium]|nr:hypothetical protein [Alphaproteobacteria bacterium]
MMDRALDQLRRQRRVAVTAGLGGLSGLISALTFSLEETWYGGYAPGAVFGLLIGLLLMILQLAGPGRALLFVVFSVLSWHIALQFALYFVEVIQPYIAGDTARMAVTGLLAGMLGAALLGAAAVWLFVWARDGRRFAVTVALGGLTGLALAIDWGDGKPLFIAWQACFALCLASGFPRRADGLP